MKTCKTLLTVCFALLLTHHEASAQAAGKAEAKPNIEALNHISTYLDELDNLAGTFLQIDQQGNSSTGRFLMKRPGLMRFDYDPPQKLKVVADGKWLAVQEVPGEKADRYPLSQTPLPIFWGKESLTDKAQYISKLDVFDSAAEMLLQDPTGDFPGYARLTFNYQGTAETTLLRSWHVVDAQGQAITIILNDLQKRENIDKEDFELVEPRRRPYGKF